MSWFDYAIITLVVISSLVSLWRGFVREALSLAIWILAFWVSWSFFRELASHLVPWIDTPSIRLGVSFGLLMLASLVVGGLVNFLIIRLIERTGLSGTDRFIGMIFGLARGVLVVAVLTLLAGLTPITQDPWWRDAQLVPYFEEMALWLRDWLPEDVARRFQFALGGTGDG